MTASMTLVVAALLVAGRAQAAAGMCADPTARVTAEMQAILQAAVQAPAAQDDGDSALIAVTDVPMASTTVRPGATVGDDATLPAPTPASDEDVPWCATPDDPRCAPLGGGLPIGAVDGQSPLTAVAMLTFEPAPPREQRRVHPRFGPKPARGIDVRVERPPRGNRRAA